MLDKLLEFGSTFDWISPLVATIQDRVKGPSHTFLIPDDCGWSGFEIKRLLRRHGIETWGLMIVDHLIMITVRLAQARWAQYLLMQERIPIEYGVLDRDAVRTTDLAQEGSLGRSDPASRASPDPGRRRGSGDAIDAILDLLGLSLLFEELGRMLDDVLN